MHPRATRLTHRLRSINIYVFSLPASSVSSLPYSLLETQPDGDGPGGGGGHRSPQCPENRGFSGIARASGLAGPWAPESEPRMVGGQGALPKQPPRILAAGPPATALVAGPPLPSWLSYPFDPHSPSRCPPPRRPVPRSSGRGRSPPRGGMDPQLPRRSPRTIRPRRAGRG